MDKKEKLLNLIFWGMVILSLVVTFHKTVIKKDFIVISDEYKDADILESDSLEELEVDDRTQESI